MSWFSLPGIPDTLLTGKNWLTWRMRVQEGSTAFDEGRAFRLPYEYSVGATPVVLKFVAPVDFNLTLQSLTCDTGNVRLDAYRGATESGTWTEVTAYARNTSPLRPYTRQVTIETGGSITPDGDSVDKLRVRSAGSTAQKANVSGALESKRRLAADTYYLVLSRIDGNDTAEGIYSIEWEELGE